MKLDNAFLAVLLMALVTYLPRMLPLAIFRKPLRSRFIKAFLKYVPYAVLGALTFPDIFYSTGTLTTALCGTVVALVLAYFERSLVTVALGAIITVYITGFFF